MNLRPKADTFSVGQAGMSRRSGAEADDLAYRRGATALRAAGRWIRFALVLARGAGEFAKAGRDPAETLHRTARRLVRVLDMRVEVSGRVPGSGLLVCNHLSYLDVLALSTVAPSVFVAKSEVNGWPVFGWFARRAKTIFVERGRAGSVFCSVGQIDRMLGAGKRVVLFPEGTSSGGRTVLPFRSSLLQAALGRPVWAAAIDYGLEPGDGDPAEEVCYWRDMTLLPHLIGVMGKRSIRCRLRFAAEPIAEGDRKELARRLHLRVTALKEDAPTGRSIPEVCSV